MEKQIIMIKYSTLLCFLLLVGVFSCQRALTPEDNIAYPLDISLHKLSEASLEITWTKTYLSNFQQYVVTRQADTLVVDANTDTTWVISDINVTKIIDNRLPLTGKFYYRVTSVSSDNTLLKSKNLEYKRKDIASFTVGAYDQLIANPALNLIYLYSYGFSEPTMQIIDVAKASITKPILLGKEISFAQSDVVFNEEMPNDLIIMDLDAIFHYDARTMTLLNQLPKSDPTINYSISSALVLNNLLYLSETDASKTVTIYNPQKQRFLAEGKFSTGSFASFRMIRYLAKVKKIAMFNYAVSSKQLVALSLNSDGTIKDTIERVNSNIWGVFSAFGLSVAPDGSSFISTNSTHLMGSDFRELHDFQDAAGNYTYSPDGKYMAYQGSNGFIIVVELSTYNQVYQFKVPKTLKLLDFYLHNNQLQVITKKISPAITEQNFLISSYQYN
jgi:hypothetical protein